MLKFVNDLGSSFIVGLDSEQDEKVKIYLKLSHLKGERQN